MDQIKFIVYALAIAAALLLGVALFTVGWFNVILVVSLLVLLLGGVRSAVATGLLGSFIYETISPFPPMVFAFSVAFTIIVMQEFLVHYVSHRSVFGAFAIGIFGTAAFEVSVVIFSKIAGHFQSGFVPFIDSRYLGGAFARSIASTLIMVGIFLIVQRFSPRTRGTILLGRYM